jgi:hypothetical protein
MTSFCFYIEDTFLTIKVGDKNYLYIFCVANMIFYSPNCIALKGPCLKIFDLQFFHQTPSGLFLEMADHWWVMSITQLTGIGQYQ